MSKRSRSKAEQVAAQALRESGFNRLPISVAGIAEYYNIKVFTEEFDDDVSGILIIEDDQPMIGVNSGHHMHRQRFSVAHELGHYLLHGQLSRTFVDSGYIYFRDSRSSTGEHQHEMEANAFAAALLMPPEALVAELGQGDIDVLDEYAVGRLATRFGVSPQALSIRLARLGHVTI